MEDVVEPPREARMRPADIDAVRVKRSLESEGEGKLTENDDKSIPLDEELWDVENELQSEPFHSSTGDRSSVRNESGGVATGTASIIDLAQGKWYLLVSVQSKRCLHRRQLKTFSPHRIRTFDKKVGERGIDGNGLRGIIKQSKPIEGLTEGLPGFPDPEEPDPFDAFGAASVGRDPRRDLTEALRLRCGWCLAAAWSLFWFAFDTAA
ncbi:hypothetical protein SISSUDRAFT_1038771 [Sistotremastrum suecicum HHB10207 ss-3]|uniref:Uncharacterized protein n=1 Tax=Sistotremastrum suecicum HHB10207 ss-3 TaxID=1314776 RepID=A0A165WCV7_9AGAM|nr:hypothetical protein SISSUDRAFT_1038771 [Sistotremastrum suecicum HHB10207 ss-3]